MLVQSTNGFACVVSHFEFLFFPGSFDVAFMLSYMFYQFKERNNCRFMRGSKAPLLLIPPNRRRADQEIQKKYTSFNLPRIQIHSKCVHCVCVSCVVGTVNF